MRRLCFVVLLLVLGCTSKSASKPPPGDAFYFPTGIVYAPCEPTSACSGFLYVASSNFDRRFDSGTVIAVNLDSITDSSGNRLPRIGEAAPVSAPRTFEQLGQTGVVFIQTFAGEMAASQRRDRSYRLFVPSRGDRNPLQVIAASRIGLSCLEGGVECGQTALSLTAAETTPTGKPRAPEPIGVGISRTGQVLVTHLRPADSPAGSGNFFESYLVTADADADPTIAGVNFISLGQFGPTTSSAVVGSRYGYVTSRYQGPQGAMILLLDGSTPLTARLEASFNTWEARGIAINEVQPETRVYVAGRSPDSLVVIDAANTGSDSLSLQVVRVVTLPPGPNQVAVISRAPVDRPLVVITSSSAGAVSIYDDSAGYVVAQLFGVGVQPFGIAVQRQDPGARIFISDFGDGRIALIDIPDLRRPQDARIMGYIGRAQVCPSTDRDIPCLGNPP